jgi:cell division protein FtsZ
MIEIDRAPVAGARIKVIGIGGGGGNAVNTMIRTGLDGVQFVACNTDAQALASSLASVKIQLGERGLGAGADPSVGRDSAELTRDRLRQTLEGADMVFVTAGMGGGTGTGAGPIIAQVAKDLGALTVGVVTKPFLFEGSVRARQAVEGIDALHDVVDTLITIPNDRLLQMAGPGMRLTDAFRLVDDVLLQAVQGIASLITVQGLINLDFADVRTIMSDMGLALMGTGRGRGENRAVAAANAAISNPLLEEVSIRGARGVLVNVTGGPDLSLHEVNEALTLINEEAHEGANIIFGSVIQDDLEDEVRVTVIATGLSERARNRREDPSALDNPSNVTPLRRPATPPPPAAGSSPRASAEQLPLDITDEMAASGDPFVSPFEEEMDVPTFIRQRSRDTEVG